MSTHRIKTWSAATGHVYRYQLTGELEDPEGLAFAFLISVAQRPFAAAVVAVPRYVISAWEASHGRSLNRTECYAVAKMKLFRTFDLVEDPDSFPASILASESDAEEILLELDLA